MLLSDLYPKIRDAPVGKSGARVVGIAKGAGMVEPKLATMLVYILTGTLLLPAQAGLLTDGVSCRRQRSSSVVEEQLDGSSPRFFQRVEH